MASDVIYEVLMEEHAASLQNRVHQYSTKVVLLGGTDVIQSGLLVEVSASFYKVVEDLYVKYIKNVAKLKDKAQIVLKTDSMDHFISTPVRNAAELTVDHLMVIIEKTQNSGVSIKFSDKLILEFLHLRLDPGWNLIGGKRRRDLLYFNKHYQKRSCRSMSDVGSNACLLASCIVGDVHEHMLRARNAKPIDQSVVSFHMSQYKQLIQNPGKNKKLKMQIKTLYQEAGIPFHTPCGLKHLPIFEKILNVSFKVISIPEQCKIVYQGKKQPVREYVYLVYSESDGATIGHYDLITNVRGFFGKRHYCTECDVSYYNIYEHLCKSTIEFWCFSCYHIKCTPAVNPEHCVTCNAKLHSQACKVEHNRIQCGKIWKCQHCRKVLKKKRFFDVLIKNYRYQTNEEAELTHDCNYYYCEECKVEVDLNHKCFVKSIKYKDKKQKILFFDFETDQSTKVHLVNYIHVMYYRQSEDEEKWEIKMRKCKYEQRQLEQALEELNNQEEGLNSVDDQEKLNSQLQAVVHELSEIDRVLKGYEMWLGDDLEWEGEWVDSTYSGEESLMHFCKDLVTQFTGYTCIAHNLKGFDGIFILKTFLENGVIPDVICKGQKLLEIKVKYADIRFIDSFNFLPMGLAKLPGAFALECGSKGYFPHFFNRPEHQTYSGVYPEPEYYGVSHMSSGDRVKFYEWFKEKQGEVFDFQEEMAEYCKQDVIILKESCMAYRRLMCQETGADPFSYVTLAAVCNAVYRACYIPRNVIARVPPAGYVKAKYSDEGYEWVEYLRRFKGVINIQHAANGGEVKLGNYIVDGFDRETNTVYEYYGCFFHGCPECFPADLRNPDTKKRMRQAYTETKHRERYLRIAGYKIVSIWGCEWRRKKQENVELQKNVTDMKLSKPLDPRNAFFGGRTECFKIWSNKSPIAYYDVTSLYPWVNCTQKYPVGHPEIILSDFKDISEYFGIIKCIILPPRNLYIPVLPMHAGPTRKLLFPLCRTCGENFQQSTCEHDISERQIEGTWFSEEVKLALEKGYKIITIQSIWHFSETTTELFAGYIRTFYKKKLLSSKLPYETNEDICKFMKEIQEKENILINNPGEFKENSGLRQITKLMLNNLWGRFGMQENMSSCRFMVEFEDFEKLAEDITHEIQTVRVINDKITQVVFKASDRDFLQSSKTTNIFIALTTTAWARIRLYKELDKVNRQVLYCDTDSIIYEESPDYEKNLILGNFLGELTSELDGDDYIEEFVSGGPKNYGFITKNGKTAVKIKGFSLNSTNAPAFSFKNIRNIILNGVTSATGEEQLGRTQEQLGSSTAEVLTTLRQLDSREISYVQHMQTPDNATAIVGDSGISVFNPVRIFRTKTWDVIQKPEQKMYRFYFDKRRLCGGDYDTLPYGF